MYTENLAINDSRQGEEVKDLTAGLPDRGVSVFLLAFLVKSIYLSNLTRFVVAADQSNLVRESEFGQQIGICVAPIMGNLLRLQAHK